MMRFTDYSPIHLGYEIGTGQPITVPVMHTCVTGQTQQAGKTTTLEALIHRSRVSAVAFRSKRGEAAFETANVIKPYFRQRSDWQFVASILEATMREKLKFERSWIIRASRGATSLQDVRANVAEAMKTARGISESVYETLAAYLDIVLPQLERLPYTDTLHLAHGLNVMDLSDYSLELQSLVVRSVLEWVYEEESGVIVVIPEAWELIPEKRGSPVKLAAEELIRKGAGSRNYLWLDSQDIAAVAKPIIKSVGVWILGVQREVNEVKRTLAHVPAPRPKPDEIMTLGLGEFFVCTGKATHKAYVQPAWMDPGMAKSVALGHISARDAAKAYEFRKPLAAFQAAAKRTGALSARSVVHEASVEDETMWKEKYDSLVVEHQALVDRFNKLEKDLIAARQARHDDKRARSETSANTDATEFVIDRLTQQVIARIRDMPDVLQLVAQRPELRVKIEPRVYELDTSTLRGRLAELIVEGFFDEITAGNAAFNELKRRGLGTAKPNVYRELDTLAKLGILFKEKDGYQRVPTAIIKRAEAR